MLIFRCALAFLLAAVLTGFLWQQLGKPVSLPDVPGGRFDCLSYTAFEEGSDPTSPEDRVSAATIDADLRALESVTGCIRVYTARGATPTVIAQAQKHGIKVLLGIWLGSEVARNELEIAAALDLASRYAGTVKMLVVGNEVLLRREMTDKQLIEVIGLVHAQAPVPVAYADVYDFWIRYPDVAKSVDVILVHLLPYWDDPAPTTQEAQDYLAARLQTFLGYFPGKQVMIGETGWPSAGPARGRAIASVIDEARFVRGFIERAHTLRVSYNLIEALDQPWKRASEGTAGGFWGLLSADRQQKFPLVGPVSAWPAWQQNLLASVALALLAGGVSLVRASAGRRFATALCAHLMASALVMAWKYVGDVSLGWTGMLFYHASLLVAGLSAVAGLDLLARGDAAWLRRPAALGVMWNSVRTGAWRADRSVQAGWLHLVAAFPAVIITLTLAVSARHRDVPWLLMVAPALLALLLAWSFSRQSPAVQVTDAPQEEIALVLIALVGVGFAFDALRSVEAVLWATVQLALLAPWLMRCLGWRAAKVGASGA